MMLNTNKTIRWSLFLIALFFTGGVIGMIPQEWVHHAVLPESAWESLSNAEQMVLKPLEEKWPELTPANRKTWRSIAERYQRMSKTEQKRVTKRMLFWASQEPVTRHKAREQFKALKKADPAKQLAIADAINKYQISLISEPIENEHKQNLINADLLPAKAMPLSGEMP